MCRGTIQIVLMVVEVYHVSTGMNVADGEQIMFFLTLDRDFGEKIAVMIINCKVYEGNEVLPKSTMIDSKIKEGCIIIIPVDYAEVQNHTCQHGTFVIIMHYTYIYILMFFHL